MDLWMDLRYVNHQLPQWFSQLNCDNLWTQDPHCPVRKHHSLLCSISHWPYTVFFNGFICPSDVMSAWHIFVTLFLLSDLPQTYTSHPSYQVLAPYTIANQNVKGQGRGGRSIFSGISLVPCLFDWFTWYMAQMKPMGWRWVVPHFQMKSSNVKITWVVWSFYLGRSVALCLFLLFCCYGAQIQPVRGDVSRIIARSWRWKIKAIRVFHVIVISLIIWFPNVH